MSHAPTCSFFACSCFCRLHKGDIRFILTSLRSLRSPPLTHPALLVGVGLYLDGRANLAASGGAVEGSMPHERKRNGNVNMHRCVLGRAQWILRNLEG